MEVFAGNLRRQTIQYCRQEKGETVGEPADQFVERIDKGVEAADSWRERVYDSRPPIPPEGEDRQIDRNSERLRIEVPMTSTGLVVGLLFAAANLWLLSLSGVGMWLWGEASTGELWWASAAGLVFGIGGAALTYLALRFWRRSRIVECTPDQLMVTRKQAVGSASRDCYPRDALEHVEVHRDASRRSTRGADHSVYLRTEVGHHRILTNQSRALQVFVAHTIYRWWQGELFGPEGDPRLSQPGDPLDGDLCNEESSGDEVDRRRDQWRRNFNAGVETSQDPMDAPPEVLRLSKYSCLNVDVQPSVLVIDVPNLGVEKSSRLLAVGAGVWNLVVLAAGGMMGAAVVADVLSVGDLMAAAVLLSPLVLVGGYLSVRAVRSIRDAHTIELTPEQLMITRNNAVKNSTETYSREDIERISIETAKRVDGYRECHLEVSTFDGNQSLVSARSRADQLFVGQLLRRWHHQGLYDNRGRLCVTIDGQTES